MNDPAASGRGIKPTCGNEYTKHKILEIITIY